MDIRKINLVAFRNNEHFQFHTEFISLVNKYGADTLDIEDLFDKHYRPSYDTMDTVFFKIRKSTYTEEKAKIDQRRDMLWRGMVHLNKSALYHFDPKVIEAAKQIKIILDTYGDISKLPVLEETSAIYNLLQDLRGKYAPQAADIGLSAWLTPLEDANTAYEQLLRSKFDEEAEKMETSVKVARKEVDAYYMLIITRIEAIITLNGEEKYTEFIRLHNLIVEKFVLTIAQRKGRRSSTTDQSAKDPGSETNADESVDDEKVE